MAELEGRVHAALHAHLASLSARVDGPEICETLNLFESGLLDSYAFVEMLAELEERLGLAVDLSDADPAEFATLRGLARCLARGAGRARLPQGH